MRIGFDAKRYYHNHTGLGNYSRTLVKDLKRLYPELDIRLYDEKSFSRTFRLGRKACEDGCQLFHGLSNELPFDLLRGAGDMHRPRTVVTIHDTAWRTFPDMYHCVDRKIYDFKYGHAARYADCVVAISESTKRDIINFYGVDENRVKVIYQPVQRMFYEEPSVAKVSGVGDAPYLLSVGSINSRKNLMGTLRAYARLKPENRPRLLVVGRGRDYEQKCRQYVKSHGLERDVEFLGFKSNPYPWIKNCKLLLHSAKFEGLPTVLVEGLLLGKLMVSTDCPTGPKEILNSGKAGMLVPVGDERAFADTAYRLLTDSALQQQILQGVEARAFDFTFPAIDQKISELL